MLRRSTSRAVYEGNWILPTPPGEPINVVLYVVPSLRKFLVNDSPLGRCHCAVRGLERPKKDKGDAVRSLGFGCHECRV